MTRHCESGKAAHTSVNRMKASAHETAREWNRRGQIAPTFYGYRCPQCKKYHLTKRAEWDGEANLLILEAAPLALQQWAITGEWPGHRSENISD